MNDKELFNILGLNDEYLRITLEKKIDTYLKQLDEEKKKQEQIDFLNKHTKTIKRKINLLLCLMTLMYFLELKLN